MRDKVATDYTTYNKVVFKHYNNVQKSTMLEDNDKNTLKKKENNKFAQRLVKKDPI